MRQGLSFPALVQKGQSLVFDGLAWSLSYVLTSAATLTSTRIPVAGVSGVLKDSQIVDGVTGNVLTIAGTLTAARTVTFPDAAVTIPAGTLIAGTLANANRLDSTSAAGVIKESLIADGISTSVLTIAGTLTAPRTLTLPDAAVTIPAGTLLTGTLANANRLDSTSSAGVVKESQIADGVTGSVLTISGTLTGLRTQTARDASGNLCLDTVNNAFTVAQTIGTDPGGTELLRVGGGAAFGSSREVIVSNSAPVVIKSPYSAGTISAAAIAAQASLILERVSNTGGYVAFAIPVMTTGNRIYDIACESGVFRFRRLNDDQTVVALSTLTMDAVGGSSYFGTDPGGTELLRVGGGVRFALGSTKDAIVVAPANIGSSSNTITETTPATALGANFIQTRQAATGTMPLIEIQPVASFQNKLINPRFDIWQRGTSFAAVANNSFTADRWLTLFDGAGVATISRQAHTPGSIPTEPEYFFRHQVTTAGAGGTYREQHQRIEGVRTLANKKVQVSFWAKADSARTITPRLDQYFGSGGVPSGTVTTSGSGCSLTTSWQQFTQTITLASISGSTIGTNRDDFLVFVIMFPVNVTCTIDFSDIEVKEVATSGQVNSPFEIRPLQVELALCQRYLPSIPASNTVVHYAGNGLGASTTQCVVIIPFPVPPRIPPTGLTSSAAAGFGANDSAANTAATSLAWVAAGFNSATITINVAAGLTQFRSYILSLSSTSSIQFTGCEL